MDVGHRPARVVGTDHRVVAAHGRRHLGRVLRVAGHHGQALAGLQLPGVARQHGDLMAALQQLVQNGRTDEAGTDQSDFHDMNPCIQS